MGGVPPGTLQRLSHPHDPDPRSTFTNSPLSIHAMTVAYDRKPVLWDVDHDARRPIDCDCWLMGPGKHAHQSGLGLVPRAGFGLRESFEAVRSTIGYVPQREWIGTGHRARCRVHGTISQTRVVPPSSTAGSRRRAPCLDRRLADLADGSDNSRADGSSGSFGSGTSPRRICILWMSPCRR